MPQPNIQNMLKQAQEAMAAQQEAQEALKEQKIEASAGGGMVTVKITGDLVVKAITIDPSAVDPDDVELLQDMVTAAVNQAVDQAQQLAASKMGAVSGGMGGPGGPLGGLGLPGM
jgi:nucleoid-associated protein EbfC